MLYSLWNDENQTLQIANAGRLATALLSATAKWTPCTAEGFPLGMFPNVKYEEFTLSTQPGDSLIFFSDGIADAQNADGDMFGDDRLKAVVKKNHQKSASKIADAILSEVSKFQADRDRFDDETVVVLRVLSGLKEHSSREPAALTEVANERIIEPARNILGSLRLPGDKSISHRYALLGGAGPWKNPAHKFLIRRGLRQQPGLRRSSRARRSPARADGTIEIVGTTATSAIRVPSRLRQLRLYHAHACRSSGAPQRFAYTLTGDASLSRRPMERVRKPLLQMGADIHLTDGHAPVMIRGSQLHGIDYTTPVPSAQVKSAVLFAGLQASGTTTVREAVRTRDHSELALRAFGARVDRTLDSVSIAGGQQLHSIEGTVPGDMSSAAFFLCAAALFPDSNLVFDSLGLNPTRATLLDVLTALGAHIGVLNLEEKHGELVGHGPGECSQRWHDRYHHLRRTGRAVDRRAARACRDRPIYEERHPHPRRQRVARKGV